MLRIVSQMAKSQLVLLLLATGLISLATSNEHAYLGCYVDNGVRDLPLIQYIGAPMTRPFCIEFCKTRGYKFSGLQFASHCSCGNTYGAYGKVDDNQCNMDCVGDKSEKCGGTWRNAVYATGLTTPTADTPGMKYLGCFEDGGDRDLPHVAATTDMSVPKCYKLCKDLKYRFFGVQFSTHCFCGNHYGRYGIKPNTECQMQCSAEKTTYCGGIWRNGVFTTGDDGDSKGQKYLGCFVDAPARDLPVMHHAGFAATKPFCIQFCKRRGYKYTGLQFAEYCACGNSFGSHGKVDESQCNMDCKGDRREKCGASWRNSIYTTDLAVHFLGCYADVEGSPELPVAATADDMSIWKCNDICKAKKQSYFGVKNGTVCGCGDQYGNSGGVANAMCNTACVGDASEKCGGSVYNGVFEVK